MKTKLVTLLALALCAGAVFMSFTAQAYASAELESVLPPAAETLSVDEVWLTGDTLHIAVTDKTDGESRTLELNLSDYAKPGDEYVTVRAADKDGGVSNAVQFKNPYYVPQADTESDDAATAPSGDKPSETPEQSEPAVPGSSNAFTPDGTGTVIDNAADSDGKEFFTVETVDGNVFYLIVDRERGADNVYLLNAVTERDLASLAKAGDSLGEDGMTSSAVPAPSAPQTTKTEIEPAPEPTPEPETPAKPGGMGSGATVFIILAALAAGGTGYYFKILRPKRLAAEPDDAGEYEDDPEDGGDFYDGAEKDAYDDERGNGE
jgi:hypothetical protein